MCQVGVFRRGTDFPVSATQTKHLKLLNLFYIFLTHQREATCVRTLHPITNPNFQVTTHDREVISGVIKTGTASSTMVKLSVRISDSDWSGLKAERTKTGAVLKGTH
jgi:hypothetical protein